MRPRARPNDIVVQEIGTELLVYDLRTHRVMILNETSASVWGLCDGKRTADEIADVLTCRTGSPVTAELVDLALQGLADKDLLDTGHDLPRNQEGANRREVLRRIAMSTVIAVPAIASIVAPPAASAQSVSCSACVKFHQGQVCGACVNDIGTCYDNAGCGGGQSTPGVTCGSCQAGVGSCAGGPETCSWRQV